MMAAELWKGQAFSVSHADGTGLGAAQDVGGFEGGLENCIVAVHVIVLVGADGGLEGAGTEQELLLGVPGLGVEEFFDFGFLDLKQCQ